MLYTELTDAEPSLGAQVGLVVEPFGGWVTVVAFEDDPQFCKIIWYLVERDTATAHVRTTSFEMDIDGGGPYFSKEYDGDERVVRYHAVGCDPVIPLAYLRTGGEGAPPEWLTTELADDFRLFWSLYEDHVSGEWRFVDENGEVQVGARRAGLRIEVRVRLLVRYLAARQLAAVGQGFFDRRGDSIRQFASQRTSVAGDLHSLHISGGHGETTGQPWLWIWVKRAILPGPIEDCKVWPFEPATEHSAFIVGHDAKGDIVTQSADPDSLSSYFEDRVRPTT